MRVSFNWLKDYVDIRTSPEAIAEKLTMAGLEVTAQTKIEQDTLWEIEVTPNRADCLSMLGIAREIAVITGKKLKMPKISSFRGTSRLSLPIQIQDKKRCQRYLGRIINNVSIGPSPQWLIQRLEAMGIRAVNNIVDITNFCLLELGQPLHVFDLDKLQGKRIIVRPARQGERIITIDAVTRELDPTILVIADKTSPQAIAGIMGVKASEVNEATTAIVLESAYFDPLAIHNASRKLGLATQSSYRFERGVDLQGVYLASLRATELIKKLARPEKRRAKAVVIGQLVFKGQKKSFSNKVGLRYAKVKETLGAEAPSAQIKDILRRLEFSIVRKSKAGLVVARPGFRADISREVDLIEEVARIYGYDNIPLNLACLTPYLSYAGKLQLDSEAAYNSVRQILSVLGLNEIMTYSLLNRQSIRKLELPFDNVIGIKNPLSYEQEVLRPTLLAGMLNTLLLNLNRKNTDLRLFELSRVYFRTTPKSASAGQNTSVAEEVNLCIGIAGRKSDNWMRKSAEYSFFDLKGIMQALLDKLGIEDVRFSEKESPAFVPGRCAEVLLAGDSLGALGELGELKSEVLKRFDISGAVYVGQLQLQRLLPHIRQEKKLSPLARYPSIDRDISLIISQDVRSGEIVSLIKRIGGELVADIRLFDQYFGEQIPSGFRGLAYSIEYRSAVRTLTAEEVDKLHNQIRQALTAELTAQIR